MSRATDATRLASSAEAESELRRILQQAGAGIRRSRNAIGRTTDYLAVAQRFLAEGGPWMRLRADAVLARRESPATYAFVRELDSLRAMLNRVGLQVAGESSDLGMEAAELARLSAEL